MRKKIPEFLAIILIINMIMMMSCKKETTPDYPELIGYWSGTTTQGNPVSFKIENKKGTLYITNYNLLVTFGSGQTTFQHTNTQGIVALTGLNFSIPLGNGGQGPAYINGSFNYGPSVITLTGTFIVYYPSSSVDVVTGSYTGYKY